MRVTFLPIPDDEAVAACERCGAAVPFTYQSRHVSWHVSYEGRGAGDASGTSTAAYATIG